MKLEEITLHHIQLELKHPFETSFGSYKIQERIIVEVKSEGLVGIGECVADKDPGYSYETVGTEFHILEDFIIPTALKTEYKHPEDYFLSVGNIRGHRMAKAGLEMAIWDLHGKMTERSLADLLGGSRARVPVGVSVGIQKGVAELIQRIEKFLEQGYNRVKIKIKPGREVAESQEVRKQYPDLQLQVDANSAYTLDKSEALLLIDDLDLLLIEQPFAVDDLLDHSRLQAQLNTPVCLDESIHAVRHAHQALEIGACKVINIKQGRVGGLGKAMEIHEMCQAWGVPVWCGGMLETGVGRAANLALATLPNFSLPGDISASDRYYIEDIIQEPFVLNSEDSTITVPTKPGLGISIDQKALKRLSLASKNFSI